MKDLGKIKQFLGVNVHHKNDKIFLEQSNFTETLLEKFDFTNAKPISTPVDTSMKLYKSGENEENFNTEIYQSAVGALLFLSTRTRPDICFAVSTVAKYCVNPNKNHWQAVKRIFRYLKGTINLGISYSKSPNPCVGYSDADFAGDLNDRKSTSGFCFMYGNGIVSWKTQKQTCVSISTAEAEYVSLSICSQEAVWLRKLLLDLKVSDNNPMLIYEDNQSALCLAKNNKIHGRAKHISIKFHYVRDMVNTGVIRLQYCPTEDMIADIFTKGLSSARFIRLRSMLGMSLAK